MELEQEVNDETETPTEETSKEKAPEIDWSKIDPSDIPHEVVKDSAPFKGLLKSTAELREEARQQREEIGAMKAQMEALDESDDEEEPDPEDDNTYLTKADLKREREKERKQEEKARQRQVAQQRAEFENASLAKARDRFTAKAEGEGFDFDTVLEEGKEYMSQHHPDECLAALASKKDPAAALYYLYRSLVPEFRKRDRALAGSQTLDQIKQGVIGKTGGAGTKGGPTDVTQLTEAALESELESQLQ